MISFDALNHYQTQLLGFEPTYKDARFTIVGYSDSEYIHMGGSSARTYSNMRQQKGIIYCDDMNMFGIPIVS